MEIVDLYSNTFMKLRKKYNLEEFKSHIGDYMIIRSRISRELRDDTAEFTGVLIDVNENEIKIKPKVSSSKKWIIEFDRLEGYEFLGEGVNLDNFDCSKNKYLIEITNIYGKKIQGILDYINYDKEDFCTSNIRFSIKYFRKEDNFAFESVSYPVGLIKKIEVLEEKDYQGVSNVIECVAKYYNTEPYSVIHPVSIDNFKLVHALHILNKLYIIGTDMLCSLLDTDYSLLKEVFSETENTLTVENNYESIARYLDYLNDRNEDMIDTGYQNIFFQKTDVIVLESKPGKGKTTMATSMLLNMAKRSLKTLYISLAESKKQLLNKLICNYAILDYESVDNNKLSWADEIDYKYARDEIGKLDITLEDNIMDLDTIINKINDEKPDVVFIDYMQLIKADKDIINALSTVACRLHIIICVLAELSEKEEHVKGDPDLILTFEDEYVKSIKRNGEVLVYPKENI